MVFANVNPKNNFFIFCTREKNFQVCMKHLLYGAKLSRPEHRVLANVKPGDLCFIYNMDKRALYGVFVVKNRIFSDTTDIGWTGNWPERFPLCLWDNYLGVLESRSFPQLLGFFRKMVTIRDISDLHERYLNSLLYEEGVKLFKLFLKTCRREKPTDMIPKFGSSPIIQTPLDAKTLLSGAPPEHVIEHYLLQNWDKLAKITGSGISEVYNQIYGFGRTYMDILTIHKFREETAKTTVIEIKTNAKRVDRGVEELSRYIYWVTKEISHDPDITYGVLLTPKIKKPNIDTFKKKAEAESVLYGIRADRINWIGYEVEGDLTFEPIF